MIILNINVARLAERVKLFRLFSYQKDPSRKQVESRVSNTDVEQYSGADLGGADRDILKSTSLYLHCICGVHAKMF